MLNRTIDPDRPAELHYLSGDYQIMRPGSYVLCAVSGVRIPLDELRYWSFERQEAYASGELAHRRASEKRKGAST